MKKLIMSLALVVAGSACRSKPEPAPAPTSSRAPDAGAVRNLPGAPDAVTAVRRFLAAAKEPDLQAMGGLFGDVEGAARDRLSRDELEKRELIMAKCLRNDRYDIVTDAPTAGGGRSFVVNLTFKDVSRSTNFQTVQGPQRRWYVQKFEPAPLADICSYRG